MTATSCVAVGTSGGFADGPSSAVITTDSGQSWATSDFPASFVLSAVRCVSGGSCITVGHDGRSSGAGAVLYSTDGGSAWSSAAVPEGVGPLNEIWCSNDGLSCLASAFGKPGSPFPGAVLVSSDGGRTWTRGRHHRVADALVDVGLVRDELLLDLIAVPAVSCPATNQCFALGIQDGRQTPFVLLSYQS